MKNLSLLERIWRDLRNEGSIRYNAMYEEVVSIKALIDYFDLYYPGLRLQKKRLEKYKSQNKTCINQKEFVSLFVLDEEEDDDEDVVERVLIK